MRDENGGFPTKYEPVEGLMRHKIQLLLIKVNVSRYKVLTTSIVRVTFFIMLIADSILIRRAEVVTGRSSFDS